MMEQILYMWSRTTFIHLGTLQKYYMTIAMYMEQFNISRAFSAIINNISVALLKIFVFVPILNAQYLVT